MTAAAPDGFLLIDKPAGATSQEAVTAVRRALGVPRAGHTGTLDPLATGLLIVLTGGATRLARFVPSEPKTYDADIVFGAETDTDDATGVVTASAPLPNESAVREGISQLTGELSQVPPAYSAKQVDGRRAYALARRGEALTLTAVPVRVHEWTILEIDHMRWRVQISCGSGTYIRALARDLGRFSGSAAHLASLRRTRIGPFSIDNALRLEELGGDVRPRPAADVLVGIPRVSLQEGEPLALRAGRTIPAREPGQIAALVEPDGQLVAVAERQNGVWQPRVVLGGA